MVYITKAELKRMENNVIDEETGCTELDMFEWNHAYDEWVVIDDSKNAYKECMAV